MHRVAGEGLIVWTHRAKSGHATSDCCNPCRFLIDKNFTMGRYSDFKSKEELQSGVMECPDTRQDHYECVQAYYEVKRDNPTAKFLDKYLCLGSHTYDDAAVCMHSATS